MSEPNMPNPRSERLLLIYVGIVFFALWVDATLYHIEVLSEESASYTPVVFAPLAGVYCLIAAFSSSFRRYVFWVGCLAVLVDAVGTFFHTEPLFTGKVTGSLISAVRSLGRPVFAPAGFAGNGFLMILAWWCDRSSERANASSES